MAQIWSVSQNKFVDSGAQTTPQNTVMSAQAGVDPNEALRAQYAALMQANPKQYTVLNAIYEKLKKPELTEAEKTAAIKKADAERIVKQLEDFYLGNKLYYGNNLKGVTANAFSQMINPGGPVAKYKALLESNSPYLAKAAGDAGNLAFQEQVQARKPFPTTRFTKTQAEKSFEEIRKKMGLTQRDYSSVSNSSGSSDILGDVGSYYDEE